MLADDVLGGKLRALIVEASNPLQVSSDIGVEDHPRWSPDGGSLVYEADSSGNWDIWTVSTRGGAPTQLTDDLPQDYQPAFSPNGKMVLYASTRGDNGFLFAVSIDGRAKHKLSDQAGDIREPVWGPFESK